MGLILWPLPCAMSGADLGHLVLPNEYQMRKPRADLYLFVLPACFMEFC